MDVVYLPWDGHAGVAANNHHHPHIVLAIFFWVSSNTISAAMTVNFTSRWFFSSFRIGKQPPASMEPNSPTANSVNEHHHYHHHHEGSITGSRSGQILWIRGLTRLQTQVGQLSCVTDGYLQISLKPFIGLVRFVSFSFSFTGHFQGNQPNKKCKTNTEIWNLLSVLVCLEFL